MDANILQSDIVQTYLVRLKDNAKSLFNGAVVKRLAINFLLWTLVFHQNRDQISANIATLVNDIRYI
jgi:hypothetical protein